MPTARSIEIFKALKKTNKKAALDYLDKADYRESINRDATDILAGIQVING
jgi:hypothetical protein